MLFKQASDLPQTPYFPGFRARAWHNMAAAHAFPTTAEERSTALDALRGLTLLGVLLSNELTEFRITHFQQYVAPAATGSRVASQLFSLGVSSSAFAVFAFLFGLGLAAQEERTRGAGHGWMTARRLVALLGLGVMHMLLVWNGDILTEYALVAIVATPLLRLPTRVLALIGIACVALHLSPLPYPASFESAAELRHHVAEASRVYARGTFTQIQWYRLREVPHVLPLLVWSAPRTLGLYLFGACAWRARLFASRGASSRSLLTTTLVCGSVGALAVLFASTCSPSGLLQVLSSGLGPLALAAGEVGTVLLLFRNRASAPARALGWLAPLGRTALTAYLAQSVVLGIVFYGYGLGAMGRISVGGAVFVALAIYTAQAALAVRWLRSFRFGPAEWAWRSITYARRLPLRQRRDVS